MNCFFCKGPAHPATGHAYTATVLACRRCFESFFAWYRARMHNPIAQVAQRDVDARASSLCEMTRVTRSSEGGP